MSIESDREVGVSEHRAESANVDRTLRPNFMTDDGVAVAGRRIAADIRNDPGAGVNVEFAVAGIAHNDAFFHKNLGTITGETGDVHKAQAARSNIAHVANNHGHRF